MQEKRIESLVKRFWETEDSDQEKLLTQDDLECEQIFVKDCREVKKGDLLSNWLFVSLLQS